MTIWLVGAGPMAIEYAKALKSMDQEFEVIGRGAQSAQAFEAQTGKEVHQGGLTQALATRSLPKTAIVALGIDQLAQTGVELLRAGVHHLLLEKPAGLNQAEIQTVEQVAQQTNASVYVAYNRRFYASTLAAKELIKSDGGITSCSFEFTEWSHVVGASRNQAAIKKAWFFANSSHVVDLAFHLCGAPQDWRAWSEGSLDWHPTSSRYCGAGRTENGVLFSYLADWQAPGRWGLEVLTRKRRLIFRPIERLQSMQHGSVNTEFVSIDDSLDKTYKPGLFAQTHAFLKKDQSALCSIAEQSRHSQLYSEMAGYTSLKNQP